MSQTCDRNGDIPYDLNLVEKVTIIGVAGSTPITQAMHMIVVDESLRKIEGASNGSDSNKFDFCMSAMHLDKVFPNYNASKTLQTRLCCVHCGMCHFSLGFLYEFVPRPI